MTAAQIDAWIFESIDHLKRGNFPEDGRVEFKSSWPTDHRRAARQIAALCNAARVEPALWIVGVDNERREVCGVDDREPATWSAQVFKHFDGGPPITQHRTLPLEDGKTVVGIVFQTDAAPFVVSTGQNDVTLEVPWRDLTRTRTARRQELLLMLAPQQLSPRGEVVSGVIHFGKKSRDAKRADAGYKRVSVQLRAYIEPRGASVYLRGDCCETTFTVEGKPGEFKFDHAVVMDAMDTLQDSASINYCVSHPKFVEVRAEDEVLSLGMPDALTVTMTLGFAFDMKLHLRAILPPRRSGGDVRIWGLGDLADTD